ncbi:MAG TPA: V-type ATP synthase subunit E family protein [Anaerolineales bacterium]|nr:V-type ATP synthase subunit E family protein [Anaerolineales bacterium]
MKPEEENIERLAKAILQEAREEAEQVRADAQAKADEIRKRAQAEAEAERQVILDRAHEDVERLRGQAVASAQLQARTLQLEHREELLNKVFDAARKKLTDIRKRSDFDKVAVQLLREALTQLTVDSAEIRADEATQKVLQSQLEDISKEFNVELNMGSVLEEGTGVVVNAANGKIHYDNTLETRLNRKQSELRSSVFQVLNGERL